MLFDLRNKRKVFFLLKKQKEILCCFFLFLPFVSLLLTFSSLFLLLLRIKSATPTTTTINEEVEEEKKRQTFPFSVDENKISSTKRQSAVKDGKKQIQKTRATSTLPITKQIGINKGKEAPTIKRKYYFVI